MSDSNEEWELSKENIRPIQQGRKPKVLKVALAPHPEDVILQQRQSFENELRTYSGNDPLAVWCHYIKWVEQNFPKGGREGQIKQLIERCLSILKAEKKYYDDDRFIDIMLKYANIGAKPIDVYNYMFSNNIGCKSATFFINWSWELEQLGNMKKADEILTEGIQRRAEPFEKLHAHRNDFEIRLAGKIKANSERNNFESENARSVFAMLKPQKKNLAPVLRTGEAVIENGKTSLILGRQPQPKSITTSVKVPFQIYNSENIDPSLPVQSKSVVPSSLNSEHYKENEQNPSKWNKVKVKPHGQYLRASHEVKPDFNFHCDEENELELIYTPRSVPKTSKILSTHCRTPSPPMALFEPPDTLKRPMYPKNKVYGGAEEYSLEEIRAVEWLDHKRKTEQEMLLVEQQKKIEEQQKIEEDLKKKVQYLAKQVELLQSHFLSSAPNLCKSSNATEIDTNTNNLENVKIEDSEFNKIVNNRENRLRAVEQNCENSTQNGQSNFQNVSCAQMKSNLDNAFSLKNNLPRPNNSLIDTFDNKGTESTAYYEASKMVQELYNRTLSQSINNDERKLNLNNELNGKCASFSSKHILSDLNEANQCDETQSSIVKESNNNLSFTFYHDPTGIITISNENVSSKELMNKEDPFTLPNEEDIENIPPKEYVQDTTKRELTGILQPSKNILFIPLEEQESDDSDVDEAYICGNGKQHADETLIPPSNTEQFSTAKFLASTPYTAKNNKSPILKNSENQIASSEANGVLQNDCPTAESVNSFKKDFENIQETMVKTELKLGKESCVTGLPNMLSVIMETSAENYKSSSSSSSASLTRSNHLDQVSSHHISLRKHYSKLETCEPGVLNSVSEVSYGISNVNFYSTSVIPHGELDEKDQKIQLYSVDFDPFDQKLTHKLLKSINISDYKNLYHINKSVKIIKVCEYICIGNESYKAESLVAEGAYAKVYEGIKSSFAMCDNDKKIALKVCKNANEWEFYICCEIQRRLSEKMFLPDIRNSVMNVTAAGKYSDGIVLINEYGDLGTLLDVINFYKKQKSGVPELIVMHFTLEILHIVSKLHECNIIHGDIKPDNFLLINNDAFKSNTVEKMCETITSLRLIDFGRSIDLNLFDKGICFTSIFSTTHFKCNEMKDKKPWVFQLDWYGVVSCIHTMLFSEYMVVQKKNGIWEIEKKFKRYWFTSLWNSLFNKLLNIPECYQEPDIKPFINMIESKLQEDSKRIMNQLSRFASAYAARK